jgi:hypothetical protein
MTALRGPVYAGCRRLTVEAAEAVEASETIRPIGLWNIDCRHREAPEYLKNGSVNDLTQLGTGCLPFSMKGFSRSGPISGGTMRMPVSRAIHDVRIEEGKKKAF